MSASLRADVYGDRIVLRRTGSRGATSWAGEYGPAEARKIVQSIESQLDVLSSGRQGLRSVRCVCIDTDGHGSLRCNGTGDLRDNLGYCYGCRTPEYGQVGPPGGPVPSHEPQGAGGWPDTEPGA